MRFLPAGIMLLAGTLIGCNSSSSASQTEDPSGGDVLFSVEASGQAVDSSYIVEATQGDSVAGSWSATVGDPVSFSLEAGTYTFSLYGVADNCLVEGENPQVLEVSVGAETPLTFQVGCLAPGEAKVTVTTTGEDQDQLYTLAFNTDFRTVLVGPYQFVIVTLPVGTYTLELIDVAGNCTVQGDNPVSLEVTEDAMAEASFAIVCTAQ